MNGAVSRWAAAGRSESEVGRRRSRNRVWPPSLSLLSTSGSRGGGAGGFFSFQEPLFISSHQWTERLWGTAAASARYSGHTHRGQLVQSFWEEMLDKSEVSSSSRQRDESTGTETCLHTETIAFPTKPSSWTYPGYECSYLLVQSGAGFINVSSAVAPIHSG